MSQSLVVLKAHCSTVAPLPTCTIDAYAQKLLGSSGALPTIEAVAPALNNVYLVQNQVDASQNGVYKLTQLNPWVLTRSVAMSAGMSAAGVLVMIRGGSTLGGFMCRCSSAVDSDVVGVNDITWQQLAGPSIGSAYADASSAAALATATSQALALRTTPSADVNNLTDWDPIRNTEGIAAYAGVNGMRCVVRNNATEMSVSDGGGNRGDYFTACHTGTFIAEFNGRFTFGQTSFGASLVIKRTSDNATMCTATIVGTGADTLYQTTAASLVKGVEYYYVWNIPFVSGQVRFWTTRIRLRIVTGGSGTCGNGVRHIWTTPDKWGNRRIDRGPRGDYNSPFASYHAWTNAPTFRAGFFDSIGLQGGMGYISVWVDGEPFQLIESTSTTQKLWTDEIDLTVLGGGFHHVEIRDSMQSFNSGSICSELLVPTGYVWQCIPEPKSGRVLWIGDSISCSLTGPTGPSINSASNGHVLPQATIDVTQLNTFFLFPTSGTNIAWVTSSLGLQKITYTSRSSTQLLGCSGGAGTLLTGGRVDLPSDVFGGVIPQFERRTNKRVTLDAYGGFKLMGSTSSADTAAFGYFVKVANGGADTTVKVNNARTTARARWAGDWDSICVILGTNDVSAAVLDTDFVIGAGTFMDDLIADHPGVPIYIMTPPPWTAKETGQGSGRNLPDLRAAWATAAAAGTRSNQVTIFDGNQTVGGYGVKISISGSPLNDPHCNPVGHTQICDIFTRGMGLNHT